MIVKCIRVCDEITRQDLLESDRLTIGKEYKVLELMMGGKDLLYRIIDDHQDISQEPMIVRAIDFEVVSGEIPSHWGISVDNGDHITVGPERWVDKKLWKNGFWEDWLAGCPEAMKCYKEEIVMTVGFRRR